MVFLSSLPEKYVGKQFEIDCVDIEIHGFEDNQPPIFKGPGVIRGDRTGRLTYKVYNQIQVNQDIFDYLKRIRERDDPKKTNITLSAKAYDGVEWNGGWSIPAVDLYQAPYFYLLVHGEFDQLATRVSKFEGDQTLNSTELVFADHPDLPFAGTVRVESFHEEEVISIRSWGDHHRLAFEDTSILFQESLDKSRLHVVARHGEQFTPPYVENWTTEALIFATARMIHPRMVIRHFEKDALVFIRATPKDIASGMPPPFFGVPSTSESFWESFSAYLSKCKSIRQFQFLDLTRGFCELCLASKGTLQGFLISLSIYIEFCVNIVFSGLKGGVSDEDDYKEKIQDLVQHVDDWERDDTIKERAKGLLSMLYTPSLPKRMDSLIEQGVITEIHKEIWKKARPYLAHGNVIDFTKEEEFWQVRNYLISMVYRLILRIIGYKGLVLDYDGKRFGYVPYKWKD